MAAIQSRHSAVRASVALAALLAMGTLAFCAAGLGFAFAAPRAARMLHAGQVESLGVAPMGWTGERSSLTGTSAWGPSSGEGHSTLLLGVAVLGAGAVAAALQRRTRQPSPRTACEAVGVLYATQTGNTETVAGYIAEEAGVEVADVGDYSAGDLADFDGLIVGCPTWNTDADEYRSGTAWDDLLDDIKGSDLSGKPVAVFGCGDSEAYGDNFCDGIGELHDTFKAAGAKMMGYVDASAYNHQATKSERDGKFLGCPFDEDNQSDLSQDRAKDWVAQLKSEGMPL